MLNISPPPPPQHIFFLSERKKTKSPFNFGPFEEGSGLDLTHCVSACFFKKKKKSMLVFIQNKGASNMWACANCPSTPWLLYMDGPCLSQWVDLEMEVKGHPGRHVPE